MNRTGNRRDICAETEPKKGWVYFIRNAKAIKIGFTTDIEQRMKRLQTASSSPLELLGTVAGTLQDEQNLHLRFANLRLRGEWFRGHTSLMAYIREATEVPEPVAAPEPEEPVQPLSPETRATIGGLRKRRNQVGAESQLGRLLSNLIEQIWNLEYETDPTARAHLERFMGWSVTAIERAARSA
jgi:hypothetical protein